MFLKHHRWRRKRNQAKRRIRRRAKSLDKCSTIEYGGYSSDIRSVTQTRMKLIIFVPKLA